MTTTTKETARDNCLKLTWYEASSYESKVNKDFTKYRSCVKSVAKTLRDCPAKLERHCKSFDITAVKTVRATMDVADALLTQYPQLKIIHLFRDPRSVANSRAKKWWAQVGLHTGYKNASVVRINEARAFCNTVSHDLSVRKELEKTFPGRIYELVYDDFMQNPLKRLTEVYEFLNLSVSTAMERLVEQKINNTYTLRWQKVMSDSENRLIKKVCQTLFTNIDVWK